MLGTPPEGAWGVYQPVNVVAAKRGEWHGLAAIVAISAVVLFYKLGTPAVYWWDEARVAVNSLEMMRNPGLVVTFRGEPDLWNTKPPLVIWLNALSMALFGVNEWALRLPSALASLGATVAVFLFTRRIADERTGFLAALALLGIGGFVNVHVSRTADFDSFLMLFLTLTAFSVYFQRFWWAALFFGLALFTKGPAALLMAPGLAGWCIYKRQWPVRESLSVAGAVVVFLGIREIVAPGYLEASLLQDVVRFTLPADAHSGPWRFYMVGLLLPWQQNLLFPWTEVAFLRSAFPWALMLPAALLTKHRALPFLLTVLGLFLVVVSLAATKLAWYVAPAYPLIAIIAALAIPERQRVVAIVVAVAFVGMNILKIERMMETRFVSAEQRPANTYRDFGKIVEPEFRYWTPDGKEYFGPMEFYLNRDQVQIEIAGPR